MRKENMGSDRNPLPPVGASGNCFALLWLGATDFNAESSGRKAATLHSLLLAGLPVASGFIVPPQLDVNGWGTELQAAVAALGGFPVAARSSSSLEDGEAASFAGQFTTCLFVTDIDGLQTAIEKCRQGAVVKFRRLMYQAHRLFTPPGELGDWQSGTAEYVDEPRGQLILKGTGCSAGRRTARARVITAISEFETLQPGEVLVTRSTDPGWTPLLGLVAGIIAETGGQLSHGAVVTREYGFRGSSMFPTLHGSLRPANWWKSMARRERSPSWTRCRSPNAHVGIKRR
jgi:hypothetical protein